MERFVFGVDLDGVVADFYGGIRQIAAEWKDVDIAELTEEVSYGLPEWGFTLETYLDMHRFAVTQRDFFRNLHPIPGAPAALRRLSDQDIHIRIITHRLFVAHFHQTAVQQTIGWLEHHGIPYRDLCLTDDKVAVGADLYIDDAPHNVEALRTVRPTIVFTNSTNRHIGGLRADDWAAVEAIVLEQREEWVANREADKKDVSGR